jgi:hypothetical protein
MSSKLGDMLLEARLITEKQLSSALEYQKEIGGKLGVILVKLNFIKEKRLVEFISQQQKIPVINLSEHQPDPALMRLIPKEFAEKHELLPVSREGNTLTVVTPDPMDYPSIDELAFTTGLKIQTVLATRSEVAKALQGFYYSNTGLGKRAAAAAAAVTRPKRATDTPAEPPPSAAAPEGGASAKRGRAAHVPGALSVDLGAPLEPRQLEVNSDRLARALAGLLVEKNVITLSELMERVARGS